MAVVNVFIITFEPLESRKNDVLAVLKHGPFLPPPQSLKGAWMTNQEIFQGHSSGTAAYTRSRLHVQ
jgi:hypothetical protein